MKRHLILVALAATLFAGCAGIRARENVLMPVMQQAFTTVIRPTAERAAEPPVAALDRAAEILASGERELGRELLGLWADTILPAFIEGINARIMAGEIGRGVAESLLETTRQFELNLMRLVAR